MGLIKDIRYLWNQTIEERKAAIINNEFKSFTVYAPSFSTYSGGVYEMDLTRSAIAAIATNASKANPVIVGDKYKGMQNVLRHHPNALMTSSQFTYKLATITFAENTAFIVPLYEDRNAGKIIGFWPVSSLNSEVVRIDSKDYLKYKVKGGNGQEQTKVIPIAEVGILRNHYYKNDYYGDSNSALNATMDLISVQNQGIVEGVKNSNSIRFMMKLANVVAKPEEFKKERDRIRDINMNSENNGGIFVYDNKYSEAKQIDSKPLVVDAEQAKHIKMNVCDYFGVNEAILQNSFTEEQWNAFYEGKIEPFLIQLSEVISRMLFTDKDFEQGSRVLFESSRMQYASNQTKLQVSVQLFDRGVLTHNQVREIWNMPPIDGGDVYYIRREYIEISKLGKDETENPMKGVEEIDNEG